MKKTQIFFFMLYLTTGFVSADIADWQWQEVEYHFDASAPNGTVKVQMNYWMDGTIVYGGLAYNKLYRKCIYQDSAKYHSNGLIYSYDTVFCGYLREDTSERIFLYEGDNATEWLLYDFSPWSAGDTLYYSKGVYTIITENHLDSVLLLGGSSAQTYTGFGISFSLFGSDGLIIGVSPLQLIRGIGFNNGFLTPMSVSPGSYMGGMIVSFYKGNQLIWKNPLYVGLQKSTTEKKIKAYTSDGCLIVEVNSGTSRLDVYSLTGTLLQSCFAQGESVVRTAPFPSGLYLYSLVDGKGNTIARGKIVVP